MTQSVFFRLPARQWRFLLTTYGCVHQYQATEARVCDFFRLRPRNAAAGGTCYCAVNRWRQHLSPVPPHSTKIKEHAGTRSGMEVCDCSKPPVVVKDREPCIEKQAHFRQSLCQAGFEGGQFQKDVLWCWMGSWVICPCSACVSLAQLILKACRNRHTFQTAFDRGWGSGDVAVDQKNGNRYQRINADSWCLFSRKMRVAPASRYLIGSDLGRLETRGRENCKCVQCFSPSKPYFTFDNRCGAWLFTKVAGIRR